MFWLKWKSKPFVCMCVCVWLLEVKRTRRQTLLIEEKLDNSYLVGHWGFTTNSLLAVHISDIRNARFDFKGRFILSNLPTIKCVRLGCGSGGRKIVNVFNDPLNTVLKMYDYIASVIRLTTTQIMREKTRCRQFMHGLHFPYNSKGSVLFTTPQTGYYIPRPMLYRLWSTGSFNR